MRTRAAYGRPPSISTTYPATQEEWDEAYAACDYATFFHSRTWAELWARVRSDRVRLAPQVVRFSDGTCAVLPLLQQSRLGGLLKTLASSIDATFGGWIAHDALGAEHAQALVDHLFTRLPCSLAWRINPHDPHAALVLERLRSGAQRISAAQSKASKLARCLAGWNKPLFVDDHTHALDLEPGFGALFGNQHAVVRKAKKARKAGVELRIAERLDEWKEYFGVYQDSIARWGRDPSDSYPWELFRLLFEVRSPAVKLWIAVYEGKIISGAVCCYAKRHVAYFHGSSLAAYFELRPVNLLMLEIIRDACERGYRWFDFGPSGFLAGVIAFKESFGAQPLPAPEVYVDDHLQRAKRAVMLGLRGH